MIPNIKINQNFIWKSTLKTKRWRTKVSNALIEIHKPSLYRAMRSDDRVLFVKDLSIIHIIEYQKFPEIQNTLLLYV